MPVLPVPVAYTCTPSSLLASEPCIKCLSEKEMWAAIVAILALNAGKSVKDAMKDAACFNCMTDSQMLQAALTILGNNLLGETKSLTDVLNLMKCLVCTSEHQLKAAALKMFCDEITVT